MITTKVLALVAKALGRKYDIRISVGRYSTASTDGKHIMIPLVDGEHAVDLARGYIDHEAAHIRLTDFLIMPTKDFKGQLLNILEDIRIEKAIGKDYPGCAANLRRLSAVLAEQYGVFKPNPSNPSTSALAWISAQGRVDTLAHTSMLESAKAAEPLARIIFGKHFGEAQRLLATVGTLPEDRTGTAAVRTLRDKFMALLADAMDDMNNPPPPPPQPQPQPEEKPEQEEEQPEQEQSEGKGSKGEQDEDKEEKEDATPQGGDDDTKDDDGDEKGADKPAGEDDAAEETEPEEGEGDTGDTTDPKGEGDTDDEAGSTEEEGDADGGSDGSGSADDEGETEGAESSSGATGSKGGNQGETEGDDEPDANGGAGAGKGTVDPKQLQTAMDALEEALSGELIEFGDIGEILQELLKQEAANVTDHASIPQIPQIIPHPQSRVATPFPDLVMIKSHTAKLRAQIAGLIQASKLKRSLPSRNGRKLDKRVLPRLRVGDDRLYSRTDEKKGVNTAVLHIVDGSSSMYGQIRGQKMFVATRACYLSCEALYPIPGVTSAALEYNDSRNQVYRLCGWGEKPDSKNFNHNSAGGTVLSTALWSAWSELMARPEPRKIAVIWSDGGTEFNDIAPSNAAIKRMREDGIEPIGIGICDSSLKHNHLPKETEVITDLNQLTPALLKLLKDKLLAA